MTTVRRAALLLLLLLATLHVLSPRALAQSPQTATSIFGRAHGDVPLALDVAGVTLLVPPAAAPRNTTVMLGVGGVPAADGSEERLGVIVTAAGGLRAPVYLLTTVAPGSTAMLTATADGADQPCESRDDLLACRIERPGAFVYGRTGAAPSPGVLDQALALAREASPPASSDQADWFLIPTIVALIVAGIAIFRLRGMVRPRIDGEIPPSTDGDNGAARP